jgi:serine/threonine-protein kinase
MSTSAKPSAQPAFGLKLPARYRVRRHIATGGMASVWCPEDSVLGRSVSDRFAHDELAVRRFKREARAAARVSAHPYVVTIFDVGDLEPEPGAERESSPRAFIVMEFLSGGTVADAVRCKSVTAEEARRWLEEAASALDHAHERGIVHRDIKPANFLLDPSRHLHVADFGIASLQSEDTITSSGELFGTAAYLAPEQALGREATGASDRYALAIAAFELLTGGRPFTASHFAAQARQHIEDEPPSASEREPSLPPAVDDVLRRGMAKEPEDRYPTAGEFVQALESALDSNPTAATRRLAPMPVPVPVTGARRPAAPARPAPRTAAVPRAGSGSQQRHTGRTVALAALAVVVLGVILLISQLSGGSGTPRPASATGPARSATAGTRHRHKSTAARTPAAASSQRATSANASSQSATSGTSAPSTGSAPPSASGAPASASALQLLGHQQLLAGSYPAAIATLHRALAAATPSGGLTYAYALYDLGRALMLSGNPAAAVPVLEARLKIPNQTSVVQAALNQALRASGQSPAPQGVGAPNPSGGAAPGKGHGHGHGGGQGGGGD